MLLLGIITMDDVKNITWQFILLYIYIYKFYEYMTMDPINHSGGVKWMGGKWGRITRIKIEKEIEKKKKGKLERKKEWRKWL